MPIVFALLGALVYGAADFCGGLASKRMSTVAVVVWSQACGLVILLAAMPILGGRPQSGDLLFGAACGVAGSLGIGLLYRGLAIGTMGIVSPITAVLAAAIPVIYGVALRGERPTMLASGGIVAALVAVVLVSWAPSDESAIRERGAWSLPPGIPEALGSGIGFGAFFIGLAQTSATAGLYPLLTARLSSMTLLLVGGALIAGPAALRVPRGGLGIVLLAGALDMSANVLYLLAIHSGGMLAAVAVLTSLYPASTVALAAIVLNERLGRLQWVGVAIAVGGAAAISAPR